MNPDARKIIGFLFVALEVLLSSCLSLISFFFSVWPVSSSAAESSSRWFWQFEAGKRLLLVITFALISGFLMHQANKVWIKKTGMGKLQQSKKFSMAMGILITLSGLAGLLYLSIEKPVI